MDQNNSLILDILYKDFLNPFYDKQYAVIPCPHLYCTDTYTNSTWIFSYTTHIMVG